jgi:hypothetical protein
MIKLAMPERHHALADFTGCVPGSADVLFTEFCVLLIHFDIRMSDGFTGSYRSPLL